MTRLQKIVAWTIGIVFLISGLGKAMNVFLFQVQIHNYGFMYLDWMAPIIVLAELVLAFLFFAQQRIKTLSLWSIFLLLLFTAVYTFGYTFYGETDCGCFGVIRLPHVSPVFVYLRNIILLGLLNYLYFTTDDAPISWTRRRWMAFVSYLVLTMFWTGMTFRPKAFLPAKSHPFVGKPVTTIPFAEYLPQKSSVMVLFYSNECVHCMNTMENYFALQRYNMVDTLVAVAVMRDDTDGDSDGQNVRTLYPQLGDCAVQASELPQITEFPTSLLIENDTIQQVFVGELPNPYLIKTNKTKKSNL